MKKIKCRMPSLLPFEGWETLAAAYEGESFLPPDPGCFLPGLESDCEETGAIA